MKEFNFGIDHRMLVNIEKGGPAEDTIFIPVDSINPSRVLKIGSKLSPNLKKELIKFLK